MDHWTFAPPEARMIQLVRHRPHEPHDAHVASTLIRRYSSINVAVVVDPDHPSIPTTSSPHWSRKGPPRTRRERAPPPDSKCHEITKRQATGRLSCRRVAACPLQILLCARGRPAPVRAVTSATNNAMWARQLGLTHPSPSLPARNLRASRSSTARPRASRASAPWDTVPESDAGARSRAATACTSSPWWCSAVVRFRARVGCLRSN